MDWLDYLIRCIVTIVVFAAILGTCTILVWFERRGAAWMQVRLGPNRAGPLGILQTVADAVKLLTKEVFVPETADPFVYRLAPLLSLLPAFLALTIVPFGPGFHIGDRYVPMQVADLNIGILWLLCMSSIAVYGYILAGWSSGSKYPLLGAVRQSAQVISYELVMSLAIIPVVMWAGTLSTSGIVVAQSRYHWYVVPLIVPAIAFFVSGIAETNRPPFDLVEADSELVAGAITEYGGVRFMMFFLAEYTNIITISAITTTMFLGGWNGPIPFATIGGWSVVPLWGLFWFLLKTGLLLFVFIWIRVSMPRLRYDQLMTFGWKVMIGVNVAVVLVVSFVIALMERGALPMFWAPPGR